MRRITIVEMLSLDGVMQAPAAADEDTRGGFTHGGWATPYSDEVAVKEMGKGMGNHELLFGRRTYEQFFSFWPNAPQPNPFTDILNNTQKYLASKTLREPLPWQNSTLLDGDAATAVADLKKGPGKDLAVLGSGDLVQTLIKAGLIDEYRLLFHPVVVGEGLRLFRDKVPMAKLKLADSITTTKGVVIGTYHPA